MDSSNEADVAAGLGLGWRWG